jgi:phytoene synthase
MTAPDQDIDALARRVDPDRWLATRFVADKAARQVQLALLALNHELARVGESVTTPLVGEIRLAWWRENLERLAGGGVIQGHPFLQALQPALASGALPFGLVEAMVEARRADLEPAPFADEAALVAYIDGTAGALMAAAAKALDPAADPGAGAARAWGWAGLFRAASVWADRGRSWRPAAWKDASDAEVFSHVAHRVEAALKAAEGELAGLPVTAFPAVAYATLARPYLKHGRLTDLGKRVRLVAAAARGRV